MVPRAADLLLALLATIAAAESLEQLPHGPYRHPRPYERRADFSSPLYPIGTGSTSRPSGGLRLASPRSSTADADTTNTEAYTIQDSEIARTTSSRANSSDAYLVVATLTPEPPPTNNSRDGTEARYGLPTIQTYNSSHVPTKIVVYETSVVLSNSSYSGSTAIYVPTSESSASNTTRIGPTAVSRYPSYSDNSSDTLAQILHLNSSSLISSITNSSGSVRPTSRFGSMLSSKLSALGTGYAEFTGNLSAGSRPLLNPPRPTFCTGATLNIRNASLDYWYPKTYTQVDSTFLIKFNENETSTGWTLLPATTSLNVTSAIENPACLTTTTFDVQLNQTQLQYACSDTPTPLALVTSTVEQTAYKPIEATSSTGDIPDVVTTPTPAAITVQDTDGGSMTYTSTTKSVIHFSQYEIVSRRSYRHWNGTVACIESTEVYDLDEPAAFEYEGGSAANDSVAVGKLGKRNAALLQALGDADVQLPMGLALGTFVAEPTVVVVVEKVVAAAASLKQGVLAPAASLETPTATLPSGLSLVETTPTDTGTILVPLTVHVETSADSLDVPSKTTRKSSQSTSGSGVVISGGYDTSENDDGGGFIVVPFVAHIESSDITLAVSVRPTQSVVTAQFGGQLVTATRVPGSISANGGGVDVGRVISAIDSAAQPTNALQVLSNAQATYTSYAAASAIAAGIGGLTSGISNSASSDSGGSNNHALIIGTSVFVATKVENGLVIDGQTLTPGGSSVTVAGQAIALDLGAGAVIIGGSVVEIGHSLSTESPSLTIGTSVLSATRVGDGLIIGGQTLLAGSSITVDGTTVSLNSVGTAVTLGGSTINISGQGNVGAAANIPVLTIGTKTYTANAATQYNVDGSILTAGGSVVISGTTLSLGPSVTQLLVNGKTQDLSAPVITPAPLLTIGNKVYKANLGSTYDIGSSLLTPGGEVIVSGTTISLPASGQSIIINGIARSIDTAKASAANLATITAAPSLILDGKAVEPNGGASYIVSGQTLTPGGAITFNGVSGLETVSLNPEANKLVTIASGHTFSSYVGIVGAGPGGAPILTVDGNTYSAVEYNAGSGATYIIDGETLTPGGVITLHGINGDETISLLPAGTAIVVRRNNLKTTSSIEDAYGVAPTGAPVLTIGGEQFSAINNGATYLVDGQTLTPGGIDTVTIAGHTYILSLSSHATVLEIVEIGANGQAVATVFETLFPATATPATITSTNLVNGVAATEGASLSSASPTGQFADDENGASTFICINVAGAMVTLGTLTLAFWL